jgi:RNA polymerase sigma-70 factor (ECF subfamily)
MLYLKRKIKAYMENNSNELVNLQGDLYRYAVMLTKDKDKALDLLQDTSLRILSKVDKYEDRGKFKAWAKKVMWNHFLNGQTSSEERHKVVVDGYEYTTDVMCHPLVADSESVYIGKEIYSCISMLSPTHAQMITMRIKGYKYEEIAKELKISVGCVKSSIFTARNKLRGLMDSNCV